MFLLLLLLLLLRTSSHGATAQTESVCGASTLTHRLCPTSQSLTVLSEELETITRPQGLRQRDRTTSAWPLKSAPSPRLPARESTRRRAPPGPPTARRSPVASDAREKTEARAAGRETGGGIAEQGEEEDGEEERAERSQRRTSPPSPADASRLGGGESESMRSSPAVIDPRLARQVT